MPLNALARENRCVDTFSVVSHAQSELLTVIAEFNLALLYLGMPKGSLQDRRATPLKRKPLSAYLPQPGGNIHQDPRVGILSNCRSLGQDAVRHRDVGPAIAGRATTLSTPVWTRTSLPFRTISTAPASCTRTRLGHRWKSRTKWTHRLCPVGREHSPVFKLRHAILPQHLR
jgi:hypothetical protein